jgi:hypothetical protein
VTYIRRRGADESFVELFHTAQLSIYVQYIILVRGLIKVITPELSSVDMSLTCGFDTTFQLREVQASPNGIAFPYWHPSFGWLKGGAAGQDPGGSRKYEHTPLPGCLIEVNICGCVSEATRTAKCSACLSFVV